MQAHIIVVIIWLWYLWPAVITIIPYSHFLVVLFSVKILSNTTMYCAFPFIRLALTNMSGHFYDNGMFPSAVFFELDMLTPPLVKSLPGWCSHCCLCLQKHKAYH